MSLAQRVITSLSGLTETDLAQGPGPSDPPTGAWFPTAVNAEVSWIKEQLIGQDPPIWAAYLVGSFAAQPAYGENRCPNPRCDSFGCANPIHEDDDDKDIDLVFSLKDPKADVPAWEYLEQLQAMYGEAGFTRKLDMRVAHLNKARPHLEVWMQGNPQTVGGGP